MNALTPIEDMTTDEVLYRLGEAVRSTRVSEWERSFCLSVLGRAKKMGRRFKISEKQWPIVRRIVKDMRRPEGEASLGDAAELIDWSMEVTWADSFRAQGVERAVRTGAPRPAQESLL